MCSNEKFGCRFFVVLFFVLASIALGGLFFSRKNFAGNQKIEKVAHVNISSVLVKSNKRKIGRNSGDALIKDYTSNGPLFVPDASDFKCFEKLKTGCKLVSNVLGFLAKGGQCSFCNLPSTKRNKCSRRLVDFFLKINNYDIKVLPEDNIFEGNGAALFWDLRGSTAYWRNKEDKGKGAAIFMNALNKLHFGPISKKYNLVTMGTGGDGPLMFRLKKKSETYSDVVYDIVRAGIELVVRFPEIKEKYNLVGPEKCGVGTEHGLFWFFFTPLSDSTLDIEMPSFVSETITNAYRCEQSNKLLNSAMTISENDYKALKDKRLQSVFTENKVNVKTDEGFVVYSATLQDMQKLYKKQT